MLQSPYVVNPRPARASYSGADVFARSGFQDAIGVADLASATVAALAPPEWSPEICDDIAAEFRCRLPADAV